MTGENPLFVARQHGHSLVTMCERGTQERYCSPAETVARGDQAREEVDEEYRCKQTSRRRRGIQYREDCHEQKQT